MFTNEDKVPAILFLVALVICVIAEIPFSSYILSTIGIGWFFNWKLRQDKKPKKSNFVDAHFAARQRISRIKRMERKMKGNASAAELKKKLEKMKAAKEKLRLLNEKNAETRQQTKEMVDTLKQVNKVPIKQLLKDGNKQAIINKLQLVMNQVQKLPESRFEGNKMSKQQMLKKILTQMVLLKAQNEITEQKQNVQKAVDVTA